HVLVSGLSGFCALVSHFCSLFRQNQKLLVLGVVVVGHEDRARRRLRVVEWVRAHPCCECRSVFVSKAPLKELRGFFLTVQLGGEPTVERVAIVDSLLACQGGKPFGSNPESTCFGVTLCPFSRPSCLLISAQ